MVKTLLDKNARWLSGTGPESDTVLYCECRLARNLADFPYPGQCTDDEKASIEERIVTALDGLNLFESGQYCSLADLERREIQFLVERRLIGETLAQAEGARGVYISDDQSMSISINDENHVTIRGIASGLQLQELWSRINLVDDSLASVLDFAFNERLGYLTASIGDVGTGLKANVVLHLPALAMTNKISETKAELKTKRHIFESLYGTDNDSQSDLFILSNSETLGRSEDEIIFHVKHLASEVIAKEREARKHLIEEAPMQLEDRIGRALGLARGARLLAFDEALRVLSSLRLGVASNVLVQFSPSQLNEVFVAAQNAQIEMKCGCDCDERTLSTERAGLFRTRFA